MAVLFLDVPRDTLAIPPNRAKSVSNYQVRYHLLSNMMPSVPDELTVFEVMRNICEDQYEYKHFQYFYGDQLKLAFVRRLLYIRVKGGKSSCSW